MWFTKATFPSFQCAIRFHRAMSTREMDGLSLIYIDANVPGLAPPLHQREAVLHFMSI